MSCIRFHVLHQSHCKTVTRYSLVWPLGLLADWHLCILSHGSRHLACCMRVSWGQVSTYWENWQNQRMLSLLLVSSVCNYSFSELTVIWILPVIGISSALESNNFDRWAMSAECSKVAWNSGISILQRNLAQESQAFHFSAFPEDLKTFWLISLFLRKTILKQVLKLPLFFLKTS